MDIHGIIRATALEIHRKILHAFPKNNNNEMEVNSGS